MSRAMVGMIDRGELCSVRSEDGRQSRGWRSGLAGTQLASTQRENRLRGPTRFQLDAAAWQTPSFGRRRPLAACRALAKQTFADFAKRGINGHSIVCEIC
jgi:hypothetical protein